MNTIADPVMQAIRVSRFSRVVASGPGLVVMAAKSWFGGADLVVQPY